MLVVTAMVPAKDLLAHSTASIAKELAMRTDGQVGGEAQ